MDAGWIIVGLWFSFWAGVLFSGYAFDGKAMNEALDRGYAVQCVGKSGIYWECE